MERKSSRDYLAHCCIYRIAVNLREFHGIAAFREFLCEEQEACGRRPEKIIWDQESVWAAIQESFYSWNALL